MFGFDRLLRNPPPPIYRFPPPIPSPPPTGGGFGGLAGGLAGLGAAIGLEASERLTGGNDLTGEAQEQAALRKAQGDAVRDGIESNNWRDRRRSVNIEVVPPFLGGQVTGAQYRVQLYVEIRGVYGDNEIRNQGIVTVNNIIYGKIGATTVLIGMVVGQFGLRQWNVLVNGQGVAIPSPPGDPDGGNWFVDGNGAGLRGTNVRFIGFIRVDGTSLAGDRAEGGDPTFGTTATPKSKTRDPVIVPTPPPPQKKKERRLVPPPIRYNPPPPPEDDIDITGGRRWFPDGGYEDWTGRRNRRTGETSEISVRVPAPGDRTRRPRLPEPVTPKEPTIIVPKTPIPPLIPEIPEPPKSPPPYIPVLVPYDPDPLQRPDRPLTIPTKDPDYPGLLPVPRDKLPTAVEVPKVPKPSTEPTLTVPLPKKDDKKCDPCLIAIEEKLDQPLPDCDRETTEKRNLLQITITTPPTQLRSTFNSSETDIVYLAGYFVFTRGEFDLAPEIPIRRLKSAHLYPPEATGFKLYPNNGAVLTANVEEIDLAIPKANPAPCTI